MRVDVNGITLGYDSYGDGNQSLLLLHAFPLNRRQWQRQGDTLPAMSGIRVIAPDLRGFGESSVAVGPTTMDQMAEDIRGLLDALNLEHIVLGGLSLGGYVAFECLRRFPERISGLILADTRAGADSPEQRTARDDTARYAEEHGSGALLDRDAPRLFSHFTATKHPEILEQAHHIAALNSGPGVASAARGMALRGDSTGLLTAISCPTLVIVGEQDAITPISEARTLFERIPDAQLELITDAGHLSNLEEPSAFTGAIARFLSNRLGAKL